MVSEKPFKELLSFVVDNRGRTCPVSSEGMPLIATNCVLNDNLYPTKDTIRFVDGNTYKSWFRAHPKPGDIVFVLKGAPGRCALVPDPVDFCIAQDMVALRADPKAVYPRYLFAALRSKQIQTAIERMHVGTMIPHFKKGDFDKIHIPLPERGTQIFIGDAYFELMNKVEINRRANQVLGAMAQAFFRDWFVEYGPSKAKMEKHANYLASELWSLFPNGFEEGVPRGWSTQTVFDQATWVNGAAYRDMDFSTEPDALPVVKIAELKNGIAKSTRFTKTDLGERYKIYCGELLFSWSGNPDTSIDTFVWTQGDAWLNQHIFAVRPNGTRSKAFLYAMLKFLRKDFSEIARNKQTTGLGHVTQRDLARLTVTIPDKNTEAAFDGIVGPIYDRLVNNLTENQLLQSAQEYILPKLLSGQIRVRDAEKLIGKVV